jgi:peptide-methionine (S)-S-oxide reductase
MIPDRNTKIPAIDLLTYEVTETATLSMGCFWSPDALFGSLEGVVRTSVGYAGGSTVNPTYRQLADHIETIQVDYDPSKISYQEILNVFFNNHKPIAEPWKRQYMSAVFWHNDEQQQIINQAKESIANQLNREIFTAVYPSQEFYLAEDRHQKYKLQRQPELMDEFKAIYPDFSDFINSTAVARVNGYLNGYGNREALKATIGDFGLSPAAQQILLEKTLTLKKVYHCSGA